MYLIPGLHVEKTDDALTVYKTGNYEAAIPLLEAAATKAPKDPILHAALLSALVYEGKVDEASDAADADAAEFPDSPEVIAACGEFAFYMGDMPEAEKLFKSAYKLKEQTARAYYGLYRLFKAASLYRTARLAILRAHEIDPDDALITRSWLPYLVPEKRKELEPPFAAAHPWLYKHFEQERDNEVEVVHELNNRKLFELDGPRAESTLHLVPILYGPGRIRGVGLQFKINGGRPLRMLLDTGASGILVKESAVDKAELNHLGSSEAWGIGDGGTRKVFGSIADICEIGSLKYKACLIRATEGKRGVSGDEDGLLGADVFSDYVIQIDFQNFLLHLTPLPPRPPTPQGYDRSIGPDEKDFTPAFRFGHALFVTTVLNSKSRGLFLIDTGGGLPTVDTTFARLSTKVRGNQFMHVRGVSGEVKEVFEADKAVIEFAGFRQRNIGLTSFNLNNSPEHQEVRMAGILGMPVLALFRLTLDYRNGLVKFDYTLKH
ncbi:MAG: aspartyl protease family protein [Acidobacteriaceae bacterium]|nr:aspartyl protease family protein [Acidobacteriaceae bacterium]